MGSALSALLDVDIHAYGDDSFDSYQEVDVNSVATSTSLV